MVQRGSCVGPLSSMRAAASCANHGGGRDPRLLKMSKKPQCTRTASAVLLTHQQPPQMRCHLVATAQLLSSNALAMASSGGVMFGQQLAGLLQPSHLAMGCEVFKICNAVGKDNVAQQQF